MFTSALRGGRDGSGESTVATAKAVHLLAPKCLPLWDNDITWKHGHVLKWADDYIRFCWQMKKLPTAVKGYLPSNDDRSILKRIDEFNYAAYTKQWIEVGQISCSSRQE